MPFRFLAVVVTGLALIAPGAHLYELSNKGRMLALAAAGCILVNLIIFYFYTQPANAVTDNWTLQPENWEALRRQWEYSHAVNAGVTFLAFCLATASAIRK
jgi:hypothetical protein